MKKSIMIFIMLIFCFINTNVYGAESVPEIEEQEITQIEISHEKILLATEKDVCDAISRIFATEKQFSYQEETLATVEYFLKTFSEATYKQFIHFHEGAWLYIAEDTTWLSKEEWDYLTRNLKRPIPLDMVNIIVQRTMNAREYLQNNHDIQNHSQFADIIHNFYPEFSEFIEGSDDAIRFWLSGDETETGIFTIQIALHEWQHEKSARLSHVFSHRIKTPDAWSVYWKKRPKIFWYYNLKDKEWVDLNYLYSPYGNSIADTIPDAVKDDYLYKLYIKETENISNCYGIYGMLQELCSAALDLRVNNISASIKYKEKSLSADDIKSYYFWKGYLMHYLDMLENRYPNTYESLMNHPDFVELIYDTFSYMEKQIDTAPVIVASARKEAAPYVEWYLMEDSQEQWCKIKTITEEKISNVKNFAVSYLTLYQLFVSKTS